MDKSTSSQTGMSRRTNLWLAIGAVAFALWQVFDVAQTHVPGGRLALIIIGLGAWGLWVVALVRTVRARRVRGQGTAPSANESAALRDARLRAFTLAFWVTIFALVLLAIAAAAGHGPALLDSAKLIVALAVVSSTFAFIGYQRASGTTR